jgi:hypothetical protein
MQRKQIKAFVKKLFLDNKKEFIKMTSLYFLMLLICRLLPYIPSFITLVSKNEISLHNILVLNNTNLFIRYGNIFLTSLISTPFLVWFYSISYCKLFPSKAKQFNFKDKSFLLKIVCLALVLSIVQLLSSIIVGTLSDYSTLLKPQLPRGIISYDYTLILLLSIIIGLIGLIVSSLLSLTIYIAAIMPLESIWGNIKKSIFLTSHNIWRLIKFVLSFALWGIIPFTLWAIASLFVFKGLAIQSNLCNVFLMFLLAPVMFGIGFFFFTYSEVSMLLFCDTLLKENIKSKNNVRRKSR